MSGAARERRSLAFRLRWLIFSAPILVVVGTLFFLDRDVDDPAPPRRGGGLRLVGVERQEITAPSETLRVTSHGSVSGDGRYVALVEILTEVVDGRPSVDSRYGLFIRDRKNGTVEQVSLPPLEGGSRAEIEIAGISADGAVVLFKAPVGTDPTTFGKILGTFVYDRAARRVRQLAPDRLLAGGKGGSRGEVTLSGDGKWVAIATDLRLAPRDTNSWTDIYLMELATNRFTLVRPDAKVIPGSRANDWPSLNHDGTVVAYTSASLEGSDGDVPSEDVVIWDRRRGRTELISPTPGGKPHRGSTSFSPRITASGRHVVFSSDARDLVPNDTNTEIDVFIRDRDADTLARASVAADGGQSDDGAGGAIVDDSGRFIVFEAEDPKFLPAGATLPPSDAIDPKTSLPVGKVINIYLKDMETGFLQLISAAPGGGPTDRSAFPIKLTGDARLLLFGFRSESPPLDGTFLATLAPEN